MQSFICHLKQEMRGIAFTFLNHGRAGKKISIFFVKTLRSLGPFAWCKIHKMVFCQYPQTAQARRQLTEQKMCALLLIGAIVVDLPC